VFEKRVLSCERLGRNMGYLAIKKESLGGISLMQSNTATDTSAFLAVERFP